MQSRGNTALPTDVVKVLKSQDENYIRTARTAGLKVHLSNSRVLYFTVLTFHPVHRKLTNSKAN